MRPLVRPYLAVTLLAASAAAVGAGAPAGHAAPAPGVVVLRDRLAGRDTVIGTEPVQNDTTVEPSIAVNPSNPLNAVAGYQMGRVDAGGDAANGFATTFDGGKTWTYGTIPGLTSVAQALPGTFDRGSDAVIAFGPDNTVYFSSLVFNDVSNNGLSSAIVNNTSHDGGLTWDPPTRVFGDDLGYAASNDKNWVVVDNGTGPGHHTGRVYVAWDRIAPNLLAYSDDQGVTWTTSSEFPGQGIGAVPVVLPNGDLGIVYTSITYPVPPLSTIGEGDVEAVSGDHIVYSYAPGAGMVPTGAPILFVPPVTIAVYQGQPVRAQRAGTLPTAAVDPTEGTIYVSWEDTRFRTDGVNDVVVSRSTDGIQWSAPVRVNPGATDDYVDRWNSWIDVGPGGDLRVMYRQRQEAESEDDFSNFIDTYYQESTDNGATFSAPLRVNRDVRTDVRYAAFSRNGAFLGDYNQIAAAGDLTYVVRCESHAVKAGEIADFPPEVHHQYTYVAVLGPGKPDAAGAPVAAPPAQPRPTTPVVRPKPRPAPLPATGAPSAVAAVGAGAVLVSLVTLRRRRARRATPPSVA